MEKFNIVYEQSYWTTAQYNALWGHFMEYVTGFPPQIIIIWGKSSSIHF